MATGYTRKLHDGPQSFEDFALECARAFGALFSLRETPNAPIPTEFTPDTYHRGELRNSRRRMETALKMTIGEAGVAAEREYQKSLKEHEARVLETDALRRRYEGMLEQVQRWTPPTPDHDPLKKFMIEQIEGSIKHDCYTLGPPMKISAETYRENAIKRAIADVDYHIEGWDKEQKSAAERTAWVQALMCSLGVK